MITTNKREIIDLVRKMRIAQDQLSKEFKKQMYVTTFLETIDDQVVEIVPYRFDLRNGTCFATNVVNGKDEYYKFW